MYTELYMLYPCCINHETNLHPREVSCCIRQMQRLCEHIFVFLIGSSLTPLAGKVSDDTRKKAKSAKTGTSHNWRSAYLSQYDWLKGSHMTKVVWLPNETDYSYCEFVSPNTLYCTSKNACDNHFGQKYTAFRTYTALNFLTRNKKQVQTFG